MLNNPLFTRLLSGLLIVLGVYLAIENTLITADVMGPATGISPIAANAIALVATGLELVFASWIRQEKTAIELYRSIRSNAVPVLPKLFAGGVGLALVYHFDISTTAQHPRLITTSAYYFAIAVGAFVFGPEVCVFLAGWLWQIAKDSETKTLHERSHKDAENAYERAKRENLMAMATEAGKQDAISKARDRWGPSRNEAS